MWRISIKDDEKNEDPKFKLERPELIKLFPGKEKGWGLFRKWGFGTESNKLGNHPLY